MALPNPVGLASRVYNYHQNTKSFSNKRIVDNNLFLKNQSLPINDDDEEMLTFNQPYKIDASCLS